MHLASSLVNLFIWTPIVSLVQSELSLSRENEDKAIYERSLLTFLEMRGISRFNLGDTLRSKDTDRIENDTASLPISSTTILCISFPSRNCFKIFDIFKFEALD